MKITFLFATISILTVAAFAGTTKPVVVSATPASGTGMQQVFTLVYAHPNGAGYIASASLLMNDVNDGRHSCWVTYDPAANRLGLVADDQLNWKYGFLGNATGISNPQCAVDLSASTVRADGTNLTLSLVLSFSSAFNGQKNLYMRAIDKSGAATGTDYTIAGTWTVGAPPAAVPSVTVAPSSGFGMKQTFSFSYKSGTGSAQLTWLILRIPTSSSSRTCWAAYDVANRLLSLANDDTNTWSYASAGQAGQLSNSQCSIDPQQTTTTANGTGVTLNLPITFQPAFGGFKTLYVTAFLSDGSISPLTATSTWDIFSPLAKQAFAMVKETDTGTHWAAMDDYQTLGSLGHQFVIVTVNPSDQRQLADVLDRAAAAHLQLIIGAYPTPYTLKADGSWDISPAGVSFINQLASHSSVVRAIFAFDEPYWLDPATELANSCGAVSAQQLRTLRNQIRSIWPQAKIYQDIGDPQSWTRGGVAWQGCVGDKFSDQSGVADYVGIWQYPFTNGSYYRQSMLDFAYNASRYVTESMSAKPVFLGQTYACRAEVCGVNYSIPSPDQIKDLNCSVRSILPSGSSLSWYVWRQSLYSDVLANHNELWSGTTPQTCSAK